MKRPAATFASCCVVHARDQDALEGDQDDEAVAEDVVVEGAEELGGEERREAPLA